MSRVTSTRAPWSALVLPILTAPLRDSAPVAIEVQLLLSRQSLLALPQGLAADSALHPVPVEEREERRCNSRRLREEPRTELLIVVHCHVSHAVPLGQGV